MDLPLSAKIRYRLRMLRGGKSISQETDSLLSRLDLGRYRALRNSFAGRIEPEKFAQHFNLRRNLREQVKIAHKLGLDDSRGLRILDLGTGKGLFPFVCNSYGHSATGLDLPNTSAHFRVHAEFLGVDWRAGSVLPLSPLPDLGERFDLITAFLICFNGHGTKKVWGIREWGFLLTDLARNHATPHGRAVFQLNPETGGMADQRR